MDYKTTIERILAIENAMDVAAIQYKGLHLWPFVRMQLWQRLLHPNKYAPPTAIGLKRLAQKLSEGFFKPDFYTPYQEHAQRHRNNLAELAGCGPVDILLYSRDHEHQDEIGGRHYNRHIDPLIDLIKTRYTFLKLELITGQTEKSRPRYEHTHFFDALDYLKCDAQRSVIAAFHESGPMPGIEEGDKLTSLLSHTRFDLALSEEYLMMEAERLLHYIQYFKELLAVANPQAVFMANYYDNVCMALIAACKSMGITTVDIQVSRQGRYHGMYAHWDHVPEGGYEMLPEYYWCWGKPSVEHIQGKPQVKRRHQRALIGGNRWMARWLEPDTAKVPVGTQGHRLIDELGRHQKTIFVSLQEEEQHIPDAVIEAMRKAPVDWFWLIRLHPANRRHIEAGAQWLKELQIKNADVDRATRLPLYFLMEHCQHHITTSSTVAVEALRFNLPTVILHPLEPLTCEDHLKEGHFAHARHADQIIEALRMPPANPVEDSCYVETNRMFAIVALDEIMGSVAETKPVPRELLPF